MTFSPKTKNIVYNDPINDGTHVVKPQGNPINDRTHVVKPQENPINYQTHVVKPQENPINIQTHKNPIKIQTHVVVKPPEVHDKPPLTIEQLREIFKRHDTDNDGRLSAEELKSAFRYLGSHFSNYRAATALFRAGMDKDGYINLKNDEFSALVSYAHSCGFKVKT